MNRVDAILVDSTTIVTRLQLDLEQLFQVSNQAFYLGRLHPSSAPLTLQMANRLHYVTNDLFEILREIEPKKVDTALLSIEDSMTLDGYTEIKRGLVQSWQWLEGREREIFRQAKGRAGK